MNAFFFHYQYKTLPPHNSSSTYNAASMTYTPAPANSYNNSTNLPNTYNPDPLTTTPKMFESPSLAPKLSKPHSYVPMKPGTSFNETNPLILGMKSKNNSNNNTAGMSQSAYNPGNAPATQTTSTMMSLSMQPDQKTDYNLPPIDYSNVPSITPFNPSQFNPNLTDTSNNPNYMGQFDPINNEFVIQQDPIPAAPAPAVQPPQQKPIHSYNPLAKPMLPKLENNMSSNNKKDKKAYATNDRGGVGFGMDFTKGKGGNMFARQQKRMERFTKTTTEEQAKATKEAALKKKRAIESGEYRPIWLGFDLKQKNN